MIQIDDAGSGSFVGGTCIGVYRPETNEYYFDIIPVDVYTAEVFKEKLYLDEAVNIVNRAFDVLCIPRSETVEVCRGYMFDKVKKWLTANGYVWYGTHITGRVQQIVEKNFELYSIKLGLPVHYIKYTRYPFHFHKLLRWVFADFENRIVLCKTGWKSWEKYKDISLHETVERVTSPHIYCLKCGGHIKENTLAKVMYYTSNKENYIYMHKNC